MSRKKKIIPGMFVKDTKNIVQEPEKYYFGLFRLAHLINRNGHTAENMELYRGPTAEFCLFQGSRMAADKKGMGVIFNLDGVLVDTLEYHKQTYCFLG